MQAQAARSGGISGPKPVHDPAYAAQQAILIARLKKRAPDSPPSQQPTSGSKVLFGLAVGLGVVLLAAFASVSLPTSGDFGVSPGSGHSGM